MGLNLLKNINVNIEKEMLFLESEFQPLYKLIKKYYEEKPNATNEDVIEYFENLVNGINHDITYFPGIKSNVYRYNACRFILENPKEYDKYFEKMKNELKNNSQNEENADFVVYSPSISESIDLLIKQSIETINDSKEIVPPEMAEAYKKIFSAPKHIQRDILKKYNYNVRRELEKMEVLFKGTEKEQVFNFLKINESKMKDEIRSAYIKSLEVLGGNFEKLGLLDKYYEKQKKVFNRFQLPELVYPLEENDDDKISIKNMFKSENLEKLSLEKLSVLHAFWINRFTKDVNSLNNCMFMAESLNLIDDIRKFNSQGEHFKINRDREAVKKTCLKMTVLQKFAQESFQGIDEKNTIKSGNYKEEEDINGGSKIIHQININDTWDYIIRKNKKDYRDIFGNSNLSDDLEKYLTVENLKYNLYKYKDFSMSAILSNLYKKEFSKNWGIIEEKSKDIKKSKMVLIGIDMEDLNMPVRLHIEKNLVKDFLKSSQKTSLIPLYEGAEDFSYGDHIISTQVLMPLAKKQKQEILNVNRTTGSQFIRQFTSHLKFLVDSREYPEHLKIEKKANKKAKVKKVIPPKRYIDLNTGKKYVLKSNKNAEMMEELEK